MDEVEIKLRQALEYMQYHLRGHSRIRDRITGIEWKADGWIRYELVINMSAAHMFGSHITWFVPEFSSVPGVLRFSKTRSAPTVMDATRRFVEAVPDEFKTDVLLQLLSGSVDVSDAEKKVDV